MDIKEHLKELNIIANNNISLEDLPLVDVGYCVKMRELYQAYNNNQIDLKKCKTLKSKIVNEYIILQDKINQGFEIYGKYQEAIRQSELLRSDVNKSSDINTMLLKSLEMVSLITGDTSFYDINARKV